MRACWLKWVGRDWSISADYIWLNYSGANSVLCWRRVADIPVIAKTISKTCVLFETT